MQRVFAQSPQCLQWMLRDFPLKTCDWWQGVWSVCVLEWDGRRQALFFFTRHVRVLLLSYPHHPHAKHHSTTQRIPRRENGTSSGY